VPATRVKYDKSAAVAEIADSFRGASAALLTEYRGLTVSEIAELRRSLGGGTQYAVVKNTLTKIAASQAGVEGIDDLLSGPTAIAFVEGDPVEAAKSLRDFARVHPLLVIKGGVLDGRPLSASEIAKLADLESREVLLSKLAGAMSASLSQAVGLFAAPLSQVARLAAALRDLKATEEPVASAPEAAVTEDVAEEEVAKAVTEPEAEAETDAAAQADAAAEVADEDGAGQAETEG
jgi:large subunit ribosomal protein L10